MTLRAAGLPVSTAHRLLTTLEQQGFAQFEPTGSAWHVGRDAFSTGMAYGRRLSFVAPALPLLRRLRDATRETANLGILDDDHLVALDDHDAVDDASVVRRAGAAPAQGGDLEHLGAIGELDEPLRAGEELRAEVRHDPEGVDLDVELVDDAGELLDLRRRVELRLVADKEVDLAARGELGDDDLPEVEVLDDLDSARRQPEA